MCVEIRVLERERVGWREIWERRVFPSSLTHFPLSPSTPLDAVDGSDYDVLGRR